MMFRPIAFMFYFSRCCVAQVRAAWTPRAIWRARARGAGEAARARARRACARRASAIRRQRHFSFSEISIHTTDPSSLQMIPLRQFDDDRRCSRHAMFCRAARVRERRARSASLLLRRHGVPNVAPVVCKKAYAAAPRAFCLLLLCR